MNWHERWLTEQEGQWWDGRGGGGQGRARTRGAFHNRLTQGTCRANRQPDNKKGLVAGFGVCVAMTHEEAVHDGRGIFPTRWKWMTIESWVYDHLFLFLYNKTNNRVNRIVVIHVCSD